MACSAVLTVWSIQPTVREEPIERLRSRVFSAKAAILLAELLCGSFAGLALVMLGAGPTAWVMSGIFAGAAVFRFLSFFDSDALPNKAVRKTGQALVGLSLGFSIAVGNLERIAWDLPVLLLLIVLVLCGAGAVGYIYFFLSRTDLVSTMLATMPGGVGIMASVAADYGRNIPLVALVQATRVAAVVVFISFLVGAPPQSADHGSLLGGFNAQAVLGDTVDLTVLLSALLLVIVVVPFASFLRVPVAPLLSAMFVGAVYSAILPLFARTSDFSPPEMLDVVGQLLLGITIGEYLGRKLDLRLRTVVYGLVSVAATILVGLIAAGVAALLTPWEWLTCVLVTAPGGAPEMIVLALALDQDVELVTTGQIMRQLAINGLLPLWSFLFHKLERRKNSG